MYLLLGDHNTITFSNEPVGEYVFYPNSSLEWTEEALKKMPSWARENFENGLRDLYSEECGYGDCEAFGATFEELAPALEYVSVEEIEALKERYGIEDAVFLLEWIDEDSCTSYFHHLPETHLNKIEEKEV